MPLGPEWRTQRACAAAFRATVALPALVLAAGASRRFGGGKALAGYGDQILLDHAICQARRLSADVRVITGCLGALLPLRARRRPASWLYAENWPDGMSAALKRGIRTLPSGALGVFVMVVDQPLLDPAGLDSLVDAARCEPGKPYAADYDGRPGVPAYLPRWLWPAVLGLEGDRGAGRILGEAGAQRLAIGGVSLDVDTSGDLTAIRTML